MATIATRLSNTGTLLVNGGFDEASLGSGSISLNGAVSPGQYLSVPSSTIGLSGQSFTIEGWFYPTDYGKTGYSASGAAFIFSSTNTSGLNGGNFGFQFFFNGVAATSLTGLGLYYNNGNLSTFSFAFQLNTWYHIALTKDVSTNTFTIFVNGNSIGSVVNSSTWTDNSPYTIGRSNSSGYERPFTGLISNFRIVRGTALYTTNFTPPTSILPAVTNTSLLLNVTNAADFIKDNGPNKFTVTNNNSATFNTSSPFNQNSSKTRTTTDTVFSNALDEVSLASGSVSFNGTNQYLTVPASIAISFGTKDLTIEYWINLASGTPTVIDLRGGFGIHFSDFFTTGLVANIFKEGTGILTASAGMNYNVWNHVAYVRSGTTLSIYINGVNRGSVTDSTFWSSPITTGRISGDYTNANLINGYISNFRVVKGTALYTTNFTPPTGILSAVANTSLLLNVTDSTNFIKDNGPNKFTVTNNNSATFNANGPFNQGVATVKQRQVTDGTLEVYSNFDEFTGAPVVDDSLVLWLDAAQTTSYPGSGTTWTDLSGKGNNGTLTSGPTYNASNGGSIVFDGSNDYVTASNAVRIGGKNVSCTVDIAFYLPSGGGGWLVTNERETSNNGQGWYWCDNTQLYFSQHSSGSPPYEFKCTASGTGFSNIRINGWNIVSFSVNVGITTMSCNFMINGYSETITNNSLVFTGTESTTDDNIDIGRFRNYVYGTTYTNVRVASLRIHNRALATDEMTTNFNALRRRYGI